MTTAQWILNLALLGWVLSRNLGTRRLTLATLLPPFAIVGAAALAFLRDTPTAGHDMRLELVGAAAGLLLGLLAAALTSVHPAPSGTGLSVSAGAAFAALWLLVIGGRIAFAEWATHSGARAVGEFSIRHQITGADAWTAAFVLMAVAMVVARYAATAAMAARARRAPTATRVSVA